MVHRLKGERLLLRMVALMMILTMFSLCTITGTTAKYSYTVGVDSNKVRAGIFRVCVKDGSNWVSLAEGSLGSTSIKLYDTLYEADVTPTGGTEENPGINSSLTVQEHVKVQGEDGKALIAPGTGGRFSIVVRNYSEVDVRVTVKASAPVVAPNLVGTYNTANSTSKVFPIEWWDPTLNGNTGDWSPNFPGSTGTGVSLNAAALGGDANFPAFTWRWVFQSGDAPNTPVTNPNWYYGNDPFDTYLGTAGGALAFTLGDLPVISIPLTITATQID